MATAPGADEGGSAIANDRADVSNPRERAELDTPGGYPRRRERIKKVSGRANARQRAKMGLIFGCSSPSRRRVAHCSARAPGAKLGKTAK
jgi:hypothetical protein